MTEPLTETELPPAAVVGVESRRRLPGWIGQVLRFVLVGGSAAALDAGTLWGLVHEAGVSFYAGRAVSISAAMVFTWWLNRTVTFRTPTPPSWPEFANYVLMSLGGATINFMISAGLVLAGALPAVGFVVGTGVAAVFNFFRYRAILG